MSSDLEAQLLAAARAVIDRRAQGDLAAAVNDLAVVIAKIDAQDRELQNLMENDIANEHILVGRERKQSAEVLEDAWEAHGVAFVLSTLARIAEMRAEPNQPGWRKLARELRRLEEQLAPEIAD